MPEVLKEKFLNILKEEKELYEDLFQAAEGKKEALIKNDVDKLLEEVEIDKEIIPQIEKKEEERNKLIEKIKSKFDIELEKNSYRELFKKLPEDWSEEFDPIREELLQLTESFNKLNYNNQQLLEQALKLNQISLNTIIDNVQQENSTYSNPKKISGQPRILNKQG